MTAPQPERALREPQSHARLVVLDLRERARSARACVHEICASVLDLRELAFMDSSSAHAIVRARQVGRRVVLLRGPQMYTLTGSSDDLEIGDTHPAEPPIGALPQPAEQELAS